MIHDVRWKPVAAGLAIALSMLLAAENAVASPWTIPNDEFVLGLNYNLQIANEEFLPDGELQPFPLEGRFRSSTMSLDGRYGFTENFEGAFRLTFKQVNYESNPVILDPDAGGDLQSVNDAVFDFSETRAGAGDVFLYGRYNFMRGVIVITTESEVKLPTGYEQPSGTFESADSASPATIEDDVTLGDGQTDFTQSMLFGAFIPPTRTFVRLDLGYKVRFGSPGHQAVGLFSVGQFIGDYVLLFASADSAVTLFEGETIGTSFIAESPEKPAGELTGDDITQREITLDKDWVKVDGGAILTLRDIELRAAYSQIVWGQNIPRIQAFSLGLVYSIPHLTGEKKAPESGESS